jgi:hypothetical protein
MPDAKNDDCVTRAETLYDVIKLRERLAVLREVVACLDASYDEAEQATRDALAIDNNIAAFVCASAAAQTARCADTFRKWMLATMETMRR